MIRHDGPNHIGLKCDALPEHQILLITSGCAPLGLSAEDTAYCCVVGAICLLLEYAMVLLLQTGAPVTLPHSRQHYFRDRCGALGDTADIRWLVPLLKQVRLRPGSRLGTTGWGRLSRSPPPPQPVSISRSNEFYYNSVFAIQL